MKQRKWVLFLIPLALMLVNLACGFSVSTAKINSAAMARDSAGAQPTTVFAPEDTFYCNVDLANAPDDTKVKADWTAVSVEGADPNTKLDSTELQTGSGVLNFKLTNDNLWPAGKYKVDLYLNDKLDRTIEFEVQ